MRFSVVIPTYKRPECVREALASVLLCEPRPDEVIVVDGDRERAAEKIVAAAAPANDVRLEYLATAPGLTHQRNAAIRVARGDVVVFVDDDVVVNPDVLAVLADAFRQSSVVGATGRVVEPRSHVFGHKHARIRRWLLAGGNEGSFTRFGYPRYVLDLDRECDVEVMQGCFMSARRLAAERVGFDESMPGYALGEDEDFSYRLSRLGRVVYLPAAVVEHRMTGFGSQDRRAFNRTVVVNRAYLFRKNFPQTPLARAQFALFLLLLLGHRLVNREWAGAVGLGEGAVAVLRGRT